MVGDADVGAGPVGAIALGAADLLAVDGLAVAGEVGAGDVEELRDQSRRPAARSRSSCARRPRCCTRLPASVSTAAMSRAEHEDAVAGVAVLAVDVALVVDVLAAAAVGEDLLLALLGRPGRAVHGHRPVHLPAAALLGVLEEAVAHALAHAVAAPHGAGQASVQGLDDLDPAGERVVLRLVQLDLDDVLALDALAVLVGQAGHDGGAVLEPALPVRLAVDALALGLGQHLLAQPRGRAASDSIASTTGRRWLSSGAVMSIVWPGLLNGKTKARIFMLTVLPVARPPWSIW